MAAKAKKPASKKAALRCATELTQWVADESALFGDDSPFRAAVDPQDPRMVVVTGENASGKSLFVRVAAAIFQREDGGLPVSVSIRERTGAGLSEMPGCGAR